ncbi:MAG: hypothetical protein ABIJ48_08205 [Actinomycetota bacterium]
MIAATVVVALVLTAAAWAGATDATTEPRAGIDADTVDGHHAGPSNGVKAERANRVLWATPQAKIGAVSLPWNVLDKHYLSKQEDTFHFIHAAEMVAVDPMGVAIIPSEWGYTHVQRTAAGATNVDLRLPISLPGLQSGTYVKIVNYRVYYQVVGGGSYLDDVRLAKLDASDGGACQLDYDPTDRSCANWTSFVRDCANPECQLSWPSGGFLTLNLRVRLNSYLERVDLGGVLVRVSYD